MERSSCESGCPCHAGLSFLPATSRRAALVAFGITVLTLRAPSLARAQATAPAIPGRSVKMLERHEVAGTDQDISLVEITLGAGISTPLHHHPVPGLGFIVAGVAESAYGTDRPRAYRAGETFQDIADVPHTIFRNPDKSAPLRFLVSYVLGRDQPYTLFP